MVDCSTELPWAEKMHRIEVGDVDSPRVGRRTLGTILLHVHSKETHVDAIHLFKGKQSLRSVRELVREVTAFHESNTQK